MQHTISIVFISHKIKAPLSKYVLHYVFKGLLFTYACHVDNIEVSMYTGFQIAAAVTYFILKVNTSITINRHKLRPLASCKSGYRGCN